MLNIRKHNILRKNSLFGKIIRFPLILIPRNKVIKIMAGPLKGKKWIVGSHNHSAWLGTYERKQSLTFLEKCRGERVLWDLGAHVGYYTLLFKSINKESKVYSFEPIESNFRYFQRHITLNQMNKVTLFENAVSRKDGVLKFARGNHVGGKLSENGDMTVYSVKLSRLLDEGILEYPDIIKMDIEGAEFEVLKDLEILLKSNRKPSIFLSTHSNEVHDACLSFINSLEYSITPLDDKKVDNAREFLIEPL